MTNHCKIRLRSFASCLGTVLALGGTAAADDTNGSAQPSQAQSSKQEQRSSTREATASEQQRTSGEVTKLSALGREELKQVQRELTSLNLYHGKIDGVAGAQTKEALRNFQTQQGIAASGDLDRRTRDALGIQATSTMSERQPVSGREDTGGFELSSLSKSDAKNIQAKLKALGLYQGDLDGVMGQATRAALVDYFQQQARLVTEGRLSVSAADALGVRINERQPASGSERAPANSQSGQPPAK